MVDDQHGPDPTQRTIESSQRELAQLERRMLDLIGGLEKAQEIRLEGIEKSQEKFEESITRVPTEVDRAVKQLREVMNETFKTVDARFEAADDAVKAALAAAKEVIAVQQRYGSDAIDKAERATAKQLDQMSMLFNSATMAVESKISDLKDRVTIIESVKIGSGEQRSATQGTQIQWVGIIGMVLGGIFGVAGLVLAITSRDDVSRPSPAVERVIERQVGPATVIDRPNQVVVPGAQ